MAFCLVLLALFFAADRVAADEESTLWVNSEATFPVKLVNCVAQPVDVPAGGNVSLVLPKQGGFWIMPQGASWDCHQGPFHYYYVAVKEGTAAGELPDVYVGYGLSDAEFADDNEDNASDEEAKPSPESSDAVSGNSSETVATEVITGVALHESFSAMLCTPSSCQANMSIMSKSYTLTINPSQILGTFQLPMLLGRPGRVAGRLRGLRGPGWGGRGVGVRRVRRWGRRWGRRSNRCWWWCGGRCRC